MDANSNTSSDCEDAAVLHLFPYIVAEIKSLNAFTEQSIDNPVLCAEYGSLNSSQRAL